MRFGHVEYLGPTLLRIPVNRGGNCKLLKAGSNIRIPAGGVGQVSHNISHLSNVKFTQKVVEVSVQLLREISLKVDRAP